MNEANDTIIDAGDLRKYRIELPNLVDDLGLSVYAFRLYVHMKRRAGASAEGRCREGTRRMAEACKMSVGQVSTAKAELRQAGLIQIQRAEGGTETADEITLVDLWPENFARFSRSKGCEPLGKSAVPVGRNLTAPQSGDVPSGVPDARHSGEDTKTRLTRLAIALQKEQSLWEHLVRSAETPEKFTTIASGWLTAAGRESTTLNSSVVSAIAESIVLLQGNNAVHHMNTLFTTRTPCSPHEHPVHAANTPCSPHEQKKEPIEERTNEEETREERKVSFGSGEPLPPPPTKKAKTPSRPIKKPCPDDFAITDSMRDWAKTNTPLVDPDTILPYFRDKWNSNGTLYADWEAGWRTWMVTEQRIEETRQAQQAKQQKGYGSGANGRGYQTVNGHRPSTVASGTAQNGGGSEPQRRRSAYPQATDLAHGGGTPPSPANRERSDASSGQ